MRKALDYLRTHPIIAVAIVVGALGVYFLWPRPQAPTTQAPPAPPEAVQTPAAPEPVAAPPPGVAPSPAPEAAGPVDAGRVDPFVPLVRPDVGGPPASFPVPPPLPPPVFPGQVPAPEASPPPPPPKEASTAAVVGLVGNSGSVAVVRIGTSTYIVSPGDIILNKIKVTVIDVHRGLVVLEEEGERFELKLGGVEGPHVAASASSHNG